MDKTLQAAQEAETLRQQQAKLLAALQAEHQQQMERMEVEAAALRTAHQQVTTGAGICTLMLGMLNSIAGGRT